MITVDGSVYSAGAIVKPHFHDYISLAPGWNEHNHCHKSSCDKVSPDTVRGWVC